MKFWLPLRWGWSIGNFFQKEQYFGAWDLPRKFQAIVMFVHLYLVPCNPSVCVVQNRLDYLCLGWFSFLHLPYYNRFCMIMILLLILISQFVFCVVGINIYTSGRGTINTGRNKAVVCFRGWRIGRGLKIRWNVNGEKSFRSKRLSKFVGWNENELYSTFKCLIFLFCTKKV